MFIINEKKNQTTKLFENSRNRALKTKLILSPLHNKIDLFNSQILNSNIIRLKDSLNEKNNFLSKYEENKNKRYNNFIFDPNINYDIEKSKIEKVSNIRGINWNAIFNENIEKGKGLGIIKLKQTQRDVIKFKNSNEKLNSKKRVNFKEDLKVVEKKESAFVPKKLISDKKIFNLKLNTNDHINSNLIGINNSNKKVIKTNLKSKFNIEKSKLDPQKENPENLFINHFLKKVHSPSPRKKTKSSSLITGTDEVKDFIKNFTNTDCSEDNQNICSEMENKNTNEKNLTVDSNMNNIKSKSFKYESNLIAEEPTEKNEESENEENSFKQKKENILNKYLSIDDKGKSEGKINFFDNRNYNVNELENNNINKLYINDYLTNSPNSKNYNNQLIRKTSDVLNFNDVKNNILSSINLNNLDLNKKEDKNLIAIKLSSHIFGVRESKLKSMNSVLNNNNVKNNNYFDSNKCEDTFNIEIRNSKNFDVYNSTNSGFLDNLNKNIQNENLVNALDSPTSKGTKSYTRQNRISEDNGNNIRVSPKLKSPISKTQTIDKSIEKFPILKSIRSKGLNIGSFKNVKNNIIPTLINSKDDNIGKGLDGLKRSNTLILNNKNSNSFHNNLLHKFQLNKSNDDSKSLSSSKISSSKDETMNSENSLISRIDTFTDSEEEIKNEQKDKFDNTISDQKILEHLKMLKQITVESPKKKANKRKYTIYDKNIMKFYDKNIRNEKHDKEIENVYGKIFGQNLEKILELRKYPERVENQTKANKNIERRKFAEKNYVNKYICDMKEKIHFMKGLLDFSYAKIICDKVKVIGDNLKKKNLKDKLKKIKKLNENEIKEVIQYLSELKYLDIGELVTDSENENGNNLISINNFFRINILKWFKKFLFRKCK